MKNIKFLSTLILSLSLLTLISCEKESCNIPMKFQVYEGFEDCGFVLTINLEDEWRTLYPSNLDEFDITPSEGLEVFGTFVNRTDELANCNEFEYVDLLSLTLN